MDCSCRSIFLVLCTFNPHLLIDVSHPGAQSRQGVPKDCSFNRLLLRIKLPFHTALQALIAPFSQMAFVALSNQPNVPHFKSRTYSQPHRPFHSHSHAQFLALEIKKEGRSLRPKSPHVPNCPLPHTALALQKDPRRNIARWIQNVHMSRPSCAE